MKNKFNKLALSFLLIGLITCLVHLADAKAQNLEDAISRLKNADNNEEVIAATDEALSACKGYDDYENLASNIKTLIQTERSENQEALYYAAAKTRFDQLLNLSKSNDLESGRRYIAVSDNYYAEALGYLDKASLTAKSKDLLIDMALLKFLIFKERLQVKNAQNVFDELAESISKYSDRPELNKEKLSSVSAKLDAINLSDYATKLKVAYASKTGADDAKDIFEEIKKKADRYFAQGDLKNADILFGEYIKNASQYFGKDELAAKVMEIAEKYYSAGRHKEARRYYEHYIERHSTSKAADYASYKIALCHHNERDHVKAISQLENFISSYQTSLWFDKAYEVLARLYYVHLPKDDAIKRLNNLIDKYYRKNVGDYARVLAALLYYGAKEYDAASSCLGEVDPTSIYFYAADTLANDIKAIRQGQAPSYSQDSGNRFRIWEPYKPINVSIRAALVEPGGWLGRGGSEEGLRLSFVDTESGIPELRVKKNSQLKFNLEELLDEDRNSIYLQDEVDVSRLPKKMTEGTEKDLLSLNWTCEDGSFSDERKTQEKVWTAPAESGRYKILIQVDDLGLVRLPDRGLRKDSLKELNVIVVVSD